MKKDSKMPMNEMISKKFNLVDEPWIKVIDSSLSEMEVSIKNLFQNAHHYKALSGETPQQDAAVLRFLLAILITVFYRFDENGMSNAIDAEKNDETDVIARWQVVWKLGQFPMKGIEDYLKTWHERFWLFHPKRPFLQVADLKEGTVYPEEKSGESVFICDMKASNNVATKHHFGMRAGNALFAVSLAEAARWLIHFNAYSMNVVVPKSGSQVGRLGQLGLILAKGDNLFETLMLNATLLKDGEKIWAKPSPTWENKQLFDDNQKSDRSINNLPEMYTTPCRKMLLEKKNDLVKGIKVAQGSYYHSQNSFNEQMTIWHKDDKDKMMPKTFDPNVQVWREFPVIFKTQNQKDHREPGLISWLILLADEELIDEKRLLSLEAFGMTYGKSSRSYDKDYHDALSLSYQLLSSKDEIWMDNISNEVDKCDNVGDALTKLGKDLGIYLYGPDANKKNKGKKRNQIDDLLKQSFYFKIDTLFRNWLYAIDPSTDEINKTMLNWEVKARRAAFEVAFDFIEEQHLNLFEIHEYEMNKSKKIKICIPEKLDVFCKRMNKIYTRRSDG